MKANIKGKRIQEAQRALRPTSRQAYSSLDWLFRNAKRDGENMDDVKAEARYFLDLWGYNGTSCVDLERIAGMFGLVFIW